MEHSFLINLSTKYGLNATQSSKVVEMVFQAGFKSLDDAGAQKLADYVCENEIVDLPPEELLEEIKRNSLEAKN